MMEKILEIKSLKKKYADFTLEDISFDLPYGYIMGLIGPNGAGKTTIIKLIMNLIQRNSGKVRVFGRDNINDEVEVKSRIGFVYDIPPFYEHLTLHQNKSIVAQFYPRWDEDLFRKYTGEFDLVMKSKFKTLSRGMKMKFQLAMALSHNADLIILDEPTSGLDPVFRRELLDLFSNLIQDEKKSILFSTHITSDLERIADFITFIKDGRIIFSEEKDRLLESWALVKGGCDVLDSRVNSLLVGVKKHEYGFEALTPDARSVSRILKSEVVVEKPTLEDIMFFINNNNGGGVVSRL
jgi:ABC-2 type transport system ATP-binding protein